MADDIRHRLEQQVETRTAELRRINEALQTEIAEHRATQEKVREYQKQLRRLAAELALTEEKERRRIAADLHDHVGQALAFIRLKVSEFQGDAVFCGHERSIEEIRHLLDQTIQYTRTLTFEISPPLLYELGLGPAVEWLAEEFSQKRNLPVRATIGPDLPSVTDERRITLFQCVRELLLNAAEHSGAGRVDVVLLRENEHLLIRVDDDGKGFDPEEKRPGSGGHRGFGLFSIRERLQHLGGRVEVRSSPGGGTCVTLTAPAEPRD